MSKQQKRKSSKGFGDLAYNPKSQGTTFPVTLQDLVSNVVQDFGVKKVALSLTVLFFGALAVAFAQKIASDPAAFWAWVVAIFMALTGIASNGLWFSYNGFVAVGHAFVVGASILILWFGNLAAEGAEFLAPWIQGSVETLNGALAYAFAGVIAFGYWIMSGISFAAHVALAFLLDILHGTVELLEKTAK